MNQQGGCEVREVGLAIKFGAVGLVGLLIDAALFRAGVAAHAPAAASRAVSLFFAMQATFTINGLHVFRCLTRQKVAGQWLGYMAGSSTGNLCNYLIFLMLVSLRQPVVSNAYFALGVGGLAAWAINYAIMRLLVFGAGPTPSLSQLKRQRMKQVCGEEASASLPVDAPLSASTSGLRAG